MGEPATDLALLDAWRAGDANAGNQLVTRHFRSVFRFFAGKVDDGVDDLVQQTFLACVESEAGRGFRGDSSFVAYLLGIARFKLLDRLRAHVPDQATLGALERGEVSLHEIQASPSEVAARGEEQRVLLVALRRLPLDLQIALELHYWEDLSTAEIATVLDVPQGTIKTRLMRGRTKLREAIALVTPSEALRESTLRDLEGWARALRDFERTE